MCIEEPGRGVTATIDGRRVTVGKLAADTVTGAWARGVVNRARLDSAAIAWVCSRRASQPARCCCGTRCAATRLAPCAGCARPV